MGGGDYPDLSGSTTKKTYFFMCLPFLEKIDICLYLMILVSLSAA